MRWKAGTGLWHSVCLSWDQEEAAVIAHRCIIHSLAENSIKSLKTWKDTAFPSMVSLWAHPLSKGDIPEVWSSFAPEMGWGRRGPCAIPRELGRTVWSTQCSQSIPAPLSISNPSCPCAAATLWIWWPRIHPWPCHTEHPSSPLLLRNTNGHLFTPNWANLVFISHLGHRISKQIFLPQTDFLTLWFQSWFAVIFVWRDVLLSVKNERTRSYIGSCTWL